MSTATVPYRFSEPKTGEHHVIVHLRVPYLYVRGIRCFARTPAGFNACHRKHGHKGRHFSTVGGFIYGVWS